MTPISQSWIITNAVGQLCRVYKAGDTFYTDNLPLRPCTPAEQAAIQPPRPTPERLLELVAEYFGITVPQICSPSRVTEFNYARKLACYLLRADYNLQWKHIARLLHRDRTSVGRGHTKITTDQYYYKHIETDLCNLRAKYLYPASSPS